MPTLYRNYRPQTFGEIAGQGHVTDALRQAIVRQRLAHAYLFYGPRGTGKTTSARVFAKRLNCETAAADNAEPCTTCALCQASQTQNNTDILEIDAASHRGIDDIRSLRDAVGLRPTLGKYKVYIIDEVHMLTHEAFAALLKTLEEPPAHAIFILATTELHKVPATIVSRCQTYRFRRATTAEMHQRLTYLLAQEKRQVENDVITFIIQRSDGCYRDAESLLGQILTAHQGNITYQQVVDFLGLPPRHLIEQFLSALISGESAPALAAVDQLFAAGHDPEQLIKETILEARGAALALAQKTAEVPNFARSAGASERLPVIIRALLQASQDLAFVPQPLVALQVAILTLCTRQGASQAPPPAAAPVKASVQPPAVAAAPRPTIPTVAGVVALERVQLIWPEILEKMRQKNPVSATFLRALEPLTIEGNRLLLRARYSLHKNFFSKPENLKPLQEIVEAVVGTKLQVVCVLQEQGGEAGGTNDLYATVKEVFGESVKLPS